MYFIIFQPVAHGLCDRAQAIRSLPTDRLDHSRFVGRTFDDDFIKTSKTRFHRRQRFLHRFMDRTPNGHRFAHRFHSRCQIGF